MSLCTVGCCSEERAVLEPHKGSADREHRGHQKAVTLGSKDDFKCVDMALYMYAVSVSVNCVSTHPRNAKGQGPTKQLFGVHFTKDMKGGYIIFQQRGQVSE